MLLSNNEDRRVRRTKRNLKHAFIHLMRTKDYRSITVTDIVEKADYNRTTFYRHYRDKEELVEDLLNEMLAKLILAFRHPYKNSRYVSVANLSPSKVVIFDYILEHKSFFTLWKSSDGIPGFQEQFIQTMIKLYKEDINYSEGSEGNDSFIFYKAYGVWGIILNWIKNDFSPSSEEMAKQLIQILNFEPVPVYQLKRLV